MISGLIRILHLHSAPHKGRTCDNRTTYTTSILSVVCNDVPTPRHPVNIDQKENIKVTTRLTSPCPQRYHTGLHALYPQSPDISTHPIQPPKKNTVISTLLQFQFQFQFHTKEGKKTNVIQTPIRTHTAPILKVSHLTNDRRDPTRRHPCRTPSDQFRERAEELPFGERRLQCEEVGEDADDHEQFFGRVAVWRVECRMEACVVRG